MAARPGCWGPALAACAHPALPHTFTGASRPCHPGGHRCPFLQVTHHVFFEPPCRWRCPGLRRIGPAHAQQAFPATLTGHAVMPALTVIPAPADAPGRPAPRWQVHHRPARGKLGSVMGLSVGRPTGISLPLMASRCRGHSGIKRMADGSFWLLTDNGAGSKANSPDFMLHLSHYTVDFQSGQFNRQRPSSCTTPTRRCPSASRKKAPTSAT